METGLHWRTAAQLILGLCWRSRAGLISRAGRSQSDGTGHLLPQRQLRTTLPQLASVWRMIFRGLFTSSDMGTASPSWKTPSNHRFWHQVELKQLIWVHLSYYLWGWSSREKVRVAEMSHQHSLLWLCCWI